MKLEYRSMTCLLTLYTEGASIATEPSPAKQMSLCTGCVQEAGYLANSGESSTSIETEPSPENRSSLSSAAVPLCCDIQ